MPKSGDIVQIFFKLENQKRGKWLSSRAVLSNKKDNGTVTVPSSTDRTISAAIEDVLPAIIDDDIAATVQSGIDEIDAQMEYIIDHETLTQDCPTYAL